MTKTPHRKTTDLEHRGARLIRQTAARVAICLAITGGLFGFTTTNASAQPIELRGSAEPLTDAGQGAVVHGILPLLEMARTCSPNAMLPPPDYCYDDKGGEAGSTDTLTR